MSDKHFTSNFDPFMEGQKNENTQSLKAFVSKIIANWYLFLIGVSLCLFLAVIYSKFADVSYQVGAKIIVKDEKKQGAGMKGMLADLELGGLLGGNSDAESELEILTSRTLMRKVVQKLHLNVTHGIKGKLRALEVESRAIPYTITLFNERDSLKKETYIIDKLEGNNFRLKNPADKIEVMGVFGTPIKLPQYYLVVNKKKDQVFNQSFQAFDFVFQTTIESIDDRVAELLSVLNAETTTKQGPVISLSFKYPVPSKGEEILQALIDIYMQDNLEDKQKMADSTLNFIDEQLAGVSSGLKGIETRIEDFKTSNELADMGAQSEELVKNVSLYYSKLNEIELQLNLIKTISSNVNNPKNKQLIPNTLNVSDPVFIQYATTYNQLLLKRQSEFLNYTEENPIVKNLDVQIENAKQNLIRGFNAFQENLLQTKKQLERENLNLMGQVKKVPKKERIYLDYTRQQNLQQQLYLYLLQKRAETAISRTSTFGNSQIIDNAKSATLPFTPKKRLFYLAGLIAGLILPFGYLSLKEMLNTRVQSKKDITDEVGISISGEIGHNLDGESLVINAKSRSVISEQFRGLRTNLQFLFTDQDSKTLLVTSSMSGEGKSFISLNLANAFAIANKKVILLEFDLRKPKLSLNIGLVNKVGFSNFIKSSSLNLQEVIQPTGLHANVFILPSGPIPPNPAELLMNPKVGEMLSQLKKDFDYVIIDTAPVGLVADALILEKFADISLYVIRQKVTFKSQLKIIQDLSVSGKLKNSTLVVNDISSNASAYYGYAYGGYGYGYGGYAEIEKGNKWFEFWRK